MAAFASVYSQELEQDPFNPEDFVERLAWRLTGGETPEPLQLHAAFVEEIENLQLLSDQCNSKISRLQGQCQEEEEDFFLTVERLQTENTRASDELRSLDGRINSVSAKVVHLGDQLQSVNAPRARAFEAFQLMKYFNEFLIEQVESEVFTDSDKLLESGEVINKLYLISQELPCDKFKGVQERIQKQYDNIETRLIEEFVRVHRIHQKNKMKQIADVVCHFKGYSQCVDAFVEQCQMGVFRHHDIFEDIPPLCEATYILAGEVFPNPEHVMAKLFLNIFQGALQDYVQKLLQNETDIRTYLVSLYDIYSKAQKLTQILQKYPIGNDKDYLDMLMRHLFAKYLSKYLGTETNFLTSKSKDILQEFYESKNHQKKAFVGGSIQDFKRDLQARWMPESVNSETLLSQEVAISILQETKLAFQRCQLLSVREALSDNAEKILDILMQFLFREYVDYAIEIAFYSIPTSEPKISPNSQFLYVIQQTNAMCHLFERQYQDSVMSQIKGSSNFDSCSKKKQVAMSALESKISNGLDRLFTAMMGYVKFLLSEQRKTDFRPEEMDSIMIPLCSSACATVVKYLNDDVIKTLRDTIDGQNLERALADLGKRFHRVIVDHVYQFQYNTSGAMLLICDINEYRKCIDNFKVPLVTQLFETLHALCNLLVVVPENIKSASRAELLADVDKIVVSNFVQLRADYRTIKLAETATAY